ncbi:hypothetical protein BH10BAC3_BH10BAC3_31550 [soil metagenome]
MRCLFTCIVVLDMLAAKMLLGNHALILFSFELLAFAIGIPLYIRDDNVLNDIRTSNAGPAIIKWNYVHSFILMALTRLIFSSSIPVMFFYITAYNYEQHLDIRYKQLEFGKQVINKATASQQNSIGKGVDY